MFFGGLQPLFFFFLGLAGAAIPIYMVALQQSRRDVMGRSSQQSGPPPAYRPSGMPAL
jgi:hypothetical protein